MSLSLIKNLARFLNPHDAFRCSQIADLVTQIYFDKQKFINLPGFLIEKCVISDFIIDFLINAQFSQKALKSLSWASFLLSSDPPPMTYISLHNLKGVIDHMIQILHLKDTIYNKLYVLYTT